MKQGRPLRYLLLGLFILSLPLLFNPLNADEAQLVQIRKGDTISYLAFKLYGMYDPRMAELLRQENPSLKDIDFIYPGQRVRFPKPVAMRKWLREKTPKPGAEAFQEPRPPKEEPPKEEILPGMQVRANKGVVTFLEGQVQSKKSGDPQWSPAQPNQILYEKDQVRVLAQSRAELILDSQSVLRLSENTLLTLQKLEEERRFSEGNDPHGSFPGEIMDPRGQAFQSRFAAGSENPHRHRGCTGNHLSSERNR